MTDTTPSPSSEDQTLPAPQVTISIDRSKPHHSSSGAERDPFLNEVRQNTDRVLRQGDPGSAQALCRQLQRVYPDAHVDDVEEMDYYYDYFPETEEFVLVCQARPKVVVPDPAKPGDPVEVRRAVLEIGPFPPSN